MTFKAGCSHLYNSPIKWHLVGADGPMHYVANTVYHAGDRDHYGLKKGESRQMVTNKGLPMWERPRVDHALHSGHECPTDSVTVLWGPYMRVGEGKERQLDFARSSAVWLDATDEELSVEPEELKKRLLARLPGLMAEFKAFIESLGFVYR